MSVLMKAAVVVGCLWVLLFGVMVIDQILPRPIFKDYFLRHAPPALQIYTPTISPDDYSPMFSLPKGVQVDMAVNDGAIIFAGEDRLIVRPGIYRILIVNGTGAGNP